MTDKYTQYLNTYAGKSLQKDYSLETVGTWHVTGEDPNCDMGGFHHQPHIGYITGKLKDVIAAAVRHPLFWEWGGGGHFELMPDHLVQTLAEFEESLNEIERLKDLENEVKRLKNKLGR